jgi:hypothetical protein
MGGGLLQLVAYGAQDAYICGNPQITFWKGLYKRHTNFAMEPFRINLTGQAAWGVKHSAIIGRHADLLYSTYIEVVMPPGAVVNCEQGRLGYNLIKYVELDIGGQVIDRLYGEWLHLWDCLTLDYSGALKAYQMVDGGLGAGSQTIPAQTQCNTGSGKPSNPTVLYIPLYFFYTKNPGAALPLIALQYHEVKINIQWNDAKVIAGNFNNASSLDDPVQASVYIDYIYLDVEERRRMAQQSHEYLIEQTQYNEDKGITSYNNRVDLTFNHPVKEIVWVVQPNSFNNCSISKKFGQSRLQPFTYGGVTSTGARVEAVHEQWLQINGQDRMDRRYGDYFRKVQMFQHHSGGAGIYNEIIDNLGLYMYSFALRPEEHQPSGTCNFSRIDTATIVMNINGAVDMDESQDKTYDVRVYAVNYNILRIMSGMAGLAYSN